jgi:hypothetical protein
MGNSNGKPISFSDEGMDALPHTDNSRFQDKINSRQLSSQLPDEALANPWDFL